MSRIAAILTKIAPSRDRLINHPLYSRLTSLQSVQQFMEAHVFAVWDFMSLLKRLQTDLTCTTVPWIPVGNGAVRYLINEIVSGEESDVDPEGGRISHFELYLRAMEKAGASTQAVCDAIKSVRAGASPFLALNGAGVPAHSAAFSRATFELAAQGRTHEVAAAFTFGREDLIPDMFTQFVKRLSLEHPHKLDGFCYYLARHIEVDGGHHGAISRQMIEFLCGEDDAKWEEAGAVALATIESRLGLWDSILDSLENGRANLG